ncbi:MAG: IgGFc-binding protein [Deltaproteobacteria bacterium]|nr:IgGFc-binding protein [Deltaproteobacteria bacterium]
MSDISGTYIEADKPISVFGGNDCAFVPSTVSYCDHLEHQLFPVATWGQEFVAARTQIRNSTPPAENDYWRVIASEDGTSIATDPSVPGLDGVTLDAGDVVEVGVNYTFTVDSSAPIMIGQFLTGHTATDVPWAGAGGDPAYAILPPYEQFLDYYVFLAPEKYVEDYVVITHPADLDVLLDGSSVGSNPSCELEAFSSEWEITRCLIPDFTHIIEADESVGITVWGYGGRVSYGYTGGLNLESINPVID